MSMVFDDLLCVCEYHVYIHPPCTMFIFMQCKHSHTLLTDTHTHTQKKNTHQHIPMHIVINVGGQIIVDDMCHMWDIQTTSSHISCNQNGGATSAEATQCLCECDCVV